MMDKDWIEDLRLYSVAQRMTNPNHKTTTLSHLNFA